MYGLNHWSSTGWRGPLLFSTVQISHFQVEVAQTKWHDATAMLALWTGTERTVTFDSWHCPSRITAGTWSSVLMAVQILTIATGPHSNSSWAFCKTVTRDHDDDTLCTKRLLYIHFLNSTIQMHPFWLQQIEIQPD